MNIDVSRFSLSLVVLGSCYLLGRHNAEIAVKTRIVFFKGLL